MSAEQIPFCKIFFVFHFLHLRVDFSSSCLCIYFPMLRVVVFNITCFGNHRFLHQTLYVRGCANLRDYNWTTFNLPVPVRIVMARGKHFFCWRLRALRPTHVVCIGPGLSQMCHKIRLHQPKRHGVGMSTWSDPVAQQGAADMHAPLLPACLLLSKLGLGCK